MAVLELAVVVVVPTTGVTGLKLALGPILRLTPFFWMLVEPCVTVLKVRAMLIAGDS